MKSSTYHGGGPLVKGPYSGGGGGGSTPDIFASLKTLSGYALSVTTGSSGDLTGAGGTFTVYCNVGITYTGTPVGEFTIVTPGYYHISAGGIIRSTVAGAWNISMGFRVNAGTLYTTRLQSNSTVTYNHSSDIIIISLAAGDTVKLAYLVTLLGGTGTVYFEEGFLTLVKMV